MGASVRLTTMESFAIPPQALLYWRRAIKSRWLIPGLNVLLVLWLAWLLAQISWAFFSGGDGSADTDAVPAVSAISRDQQRHSDRQIADWHLFGAESRAQPVKQEAAPVDAPDTRLRLTLSGVFASSDDNEARAIIGDERGKEDSYAPGDSLPGGVKLSAIHADRVILQRNGLYETLRLPRDLGRGRSATPSISHRQSRSVSGSGDASSGVNRNAALQRYRSEIKSNPNSFMEYVRASPARQNGQFIGFRLQPGRKAGALAELGLQPGDVVTSINGVMIDNPAKGMEAMRALGKGQNVNVTLLRGGEDVSMNFSLPAQ
jgi:general secretion pathway protein C